jgi:hypothetical protein
MESLGWEREVRRERRQLTSITSILDTPARHLYHTYSYIGHQQNFQMEKFQAVWEYKQLSTNILGKGKRWGFLIT